MNQILKQYFRCYINYEQNNWVQFLLLVQYIYNSAISKTTGIILFYTNYGFKPDITREPLKREFSPAVIE